MQVMIVKAIKTPIINVNDSLEKTITNSIDVIQENSILAVTSKIVALSEGRVADLNNDKHELVKKEAEYYLDPTQSQYNLMLTIKHSILAVNAGLDRSNVKDAFVYLPQDPFLSARKIWEFIKSYYQLKNVGVIITDSKTFPLKWGTIGTCLAHCGFKALIDKRGENDIFGYELQMTQVNLAEGLASAAVAEMGEGNESTPLALISDVRQAEFVGAPPSEKEIKNSLIAIEDDAYGPILTKANWQKGGAL